MLAIEWLYVYVYIPPRVGVYVYYTYMGERGGVFLFIYIVGRKFAMRLGGGVRIFISNLRMGVYVYIHIYEREWGCLNIHV